MLRVAGLVIPSLLSFAFGLCLTAQGNASDSYALVSGIPYGSTSESTNLCVYDTDHDGLAELLICKGSTVRIFEYRGNHQYEKVDSIGGIGVWAVGDIDEDGLTDLVVQNTSHVMVYESIRTDSLDCQKVWEWEPPFAGLAAPSYITDADRDGNNELFVNFGSIIDFEKIGDNTYSEVWRDTSWDGYYEFGDFDGDKKTEFAASRGSGLYYIYENSDSAVDNYDLVASGSVPNVNNAYYKSSSPDTDGDGTMEFMIAGNRDGATGWTWQMNVLEATGDNSYEVVWFDSVADCPWFNKSWISCGDVDGDSVNEILWGIGAKGLFLYECVGPDQWDCVWSYPVSRGISNVLVYDINNNGYAEMIMARTDSTLIFEKEGVGVAEWEYERTRSAFCLEQNRPNPFSRSTEISYSLPATTHVSLEVYDTAGRVIEILVDGMQPPGIHQVRWDKKNSLSGVYFYRIKAGDHRSAKKMILLR